MALKKEKHSSEREIVTIELLFKCVLMAYLIRQIARNIILK